MIRRYYMRWSTPLAVLATLVTGINNPIGLALDLPAGKMYWGSQLADTLQQANLDASDVETVLETGPFPDDVALDVAAGKVCWTDLPYFCGRPRVINSSR